MPAMSVGQQLVLDELRDELSRAHAVAEAHVVVVQKNREQPHVVARRFRLLVDRVADCARRLGVPTPAFSVTLMSLKVWIVCGLPSSVTSKSSWRQDRERDCPACR